MQYKTHLAVTYAVSLPLMAASPSFTVGNLAAVGIGAVIPDIDHPKSFIGARTRGVSDGIGKLFGHRGLAHSILGAVFFAVLYNLMLSFFSFPLEGTEWFFFGYMAHLVEDSFSKRGVAWLQPLYNKPIQFGLKKIYYRTGAFSEDLIFITACIVILYHIINFNLIGRLNTQLLQMIQSVSFS